MSAVTVIRKVFTLVFFATAVAVLSLLGLGVKQDGERNFSLGISPALADVPGELSAGESSGTAGESSGTAGEASAAGEAGESGGCESAGGSS